MVERRGGKSTVYPNSHDRLTRRCPGNGLVHDVAKTGQYARRFFFCCLEATPGKTREISQITQKKREKTKKKGEKNGGKQGKNDQKHEKKRKNCAQNALPVQHDFARKNAAISTENGLFVVPN